MRRQSPGVVAARPNGFGKTDDFLENRAARCQRRGTPDRFAVQHQSRLIVPQSRLLSSRSDPSTFRCSSTTACRDTASRSPALQAKYPKVFGSTREKGSSSLEFSGCEYY
ncbi:MAG: hypothetical protein ACK53L_02035, partial [Pirellulaceae bacterium]